jgi:hypothetical protein
MSDDSFLNEKEIELLVGQTVDHPQNGPLTDDEVMCVLKWARNNRVHAALLELVLRGEVEITWDRDEQTIQCQMSGG